MMEFWREHIVCDPAVLSGKPCIKNSRISVEFLMERLEDAWSVADLCNAYPALKASDIEAAMAFSQESQ